MFRVAAVTVTATAITLDLSTSSASPDNCVSIDVPYDDLNLLQADDAETLAHRLRAAAQQVGRKAHKKGARRGEIDKRAVEKCIDVAIRGAITSVKNRVDDKILASLINTRQQMAHRNLVMAWAETAS